MKKIKMWFLKVFFPKKYCEALGKDIAKRLVDAYERATISVQAATETMRNYGKQRGAND